MGGALLATGDTSGDIGIYPPNAPWASFFGAISPDEDFVETYKFYVMTQAGLTSLPLQITNQPTRDIPKDYLGNLKPKLAGKVPCIVTALQGTAPLRK